MGTYNTYSQEQICFLKENAPLMSRSELTKQFNDRFCASRSVSGIKAFCNRIGFYSPSDGKFKKGHVSWQTGLNGNEYKSHFTEASFQQSLNKMLDANKTRKIGDEIIIKGEPWVVTSLEYGVPFHKRRQPKRRVVWERLHGEIPSDHCVVCLDGNPMNCDPTNLYCMPIRYRPLIAKNRWWFGNAELTLTAIKWCELFYAIRDGEYLEAAEIPQQKGYI